VRNVAVFEKIERAASFVSSLLGIGTVIFIVILIAYNWDDIREISVGGATIKKATKEAVLSAEKTKKIEAQVGKQQKIIEEAVDKSGAALSLITALEKRTRRWLPK
jgi:hypothetical protein